MTAAEGCAVQSLSINETHVGDKVVKDVAEYKADKSSDFLK